MNINVVISRRVNEPLHRLTKSEAAVCARCCPCVEVAATFNTPSIPLLELFLEKKREREMRHCKRERERVCVCVCECVRERESSWRHRHLFGHAKLSDRSH